MTRAASRRFWTSDSKSGKERIRAEDVKKKLLKKDMAGNLTGSLGVGVGELAADNDLIHLRPVQIAAGFVELAGEVADVVLGALI